MPEPFSPQEHGAQSTADLPEGFKMTELGLLPEAWNIVPFDKAIIRSVRVPKVKRSAYRPIGRVPVVDQGQAFIGGFVDDVRPYDADLPVIVFGDHTRIVKFVDFPFVAGADGTQVLRPNRQQFDPQFLYYVLQNIEIPSRGYNRHFGLLREKSFSQPPIGEQRAIAHVLRTVQQAKEATEKVIAATRQLKQSLMLHLFTYGPVPYDQADRVKLKETEIGPVPEHWDRTLCESLCETITVGVVVKPASHYVEVGVPAFRSLNVREDKLDTRDLVFFSNTANEGPLAKSKLREGDVLIVRTGYPGTACVVPKEYEGTNCIDLVIARPNTNQVLSEFLSRFLNSAAGKRQALNAKVGLAQQHLNVAAVKRTLVPVPPISEQRQITAQLAVVDAKLAAEETRRAALNTLFQSLLHHLMTGKVCVHDLELPSMKEDVP